MAEGPSANVSAADLDEETKKKLKGDTIGDTLYSESFVIRTLMNLSQLKYTEEEEQDLCFLWDMTLEKDVCNLLFELQYPTLAGAALANCTQGRYVELIIGILGNLLMADCDKSISEKEIKPVLKEFDTDDSAVLTQLMRFIEVIAYKFPEHITLFGPEVIIEKMQFVLNYSTNFDLIMHTVQAYIRLTEDFKVDKHFVNGSLIKSVVEGFDTVALVEVPPGGNNFEVELDSEDACKTVGTFFNLLSNICAYANEYHHDDSIAEAINKSGTLAMVICQISLHLTVEENLFPITTTFNQCISAFITILTVKDVTLVQEDTFFYFSFQRLCEVLYLLHRCKSEVHDSFCLVLELVANYVHLADEGDVCVVLTRVGYKKGIVVLNSLREISRSLDINISEKLKALYEGYK